MIFDLLRRIIITLEIDACSSAGKLAPLRRYGHNVNKRYFSTEAAAKQSFEKIKRRMLSNRTLIYQTDGVELWTGGVVCASMGQEQIVKSYNKPIDAVRHFLVKQGASSVYGKIKTFEWMKKRNDC